jgi:glucose/mannose-6-phosphate isomerase
MKEWILQFPNHLEESLERYSVPRRKHKRNIRAILLCGMGGSAFGGKLVKHYVDHQLAVPFDIRQDYTLPAYVNEETLVIASSYSGDTEETLACVKEAIERGAAVVGITSGGKLKAMLSELDLPYYALPSGFAPRAAVGYSISALLSLLTHWDFLSNKWHEEVIQAIHILRQEDFQTRGQQVASRLHGHLPVLYATTLMEPLAIRLRQQLNENSKHLCWHHTIPELNHNEIVGWENPRCLFPNLCVLFFHCPHDLERNRVRLRLTAERIEKQGVPVMHLQLPSYPLLTYMLLLLHWVDWISYELALLNQVDPLPVKVIDHFKAQLKQSFENRI